MGAVKKRAEREKIGKQCQKSLQHETRHLSTGKFDVQINSNNIGTRTVDYWLWITDQDLRVTFFCGGGGHNFKANTLIFFHVCLISLQVLLLIVNSLKTT